MLLLMMPVLLLLLPMQMPWLSLLLGVMAKRLVLFCWNPCRAMSSLCSATFSWANGF